MSELTFKTREEYLEYRAEWKKAYKELSKEIRKAKSCRKEYQWKYREKGDTTSKRRTKIGSNPDYDSYAGGRAAYLKIKAKRMLDELVEAKIRAGEQRAARLNKEKIAA